MAMKGKHWHDPEYAGVWELAIEHDAPVSFHGVPSGRPHSSARHGDGGGVIVALDHAVGFPFENMISMGHLIYTGILERNPKLRVSFLEGSAGWLPFWLGRMDDHAVPGHRQEVFFDAPTLPLKPSEYFFRQGFVACDGDEAALKGAVDLSGDDHIVWNTDYPHADAPDPDKGHPLPLGPAHLGRVQAQDPLGQPHQALRPEDRQLAPSGNAKGPYQSVEPLSFCPPSTLPPEPPPTGESRGVSPLSGAASRSGGCAPSYQKTSEGGPTQRRNSPPQARAALPPPLLGERPTHSGG